MTELLEARRLEPVPMEAQAVEELVQKALTLTEADQSLLKSRKKKRTLTFCVMLALAAAECFLGFFLWGDPGMGQESFYVLEGLSIGFGVYFWCFAWERLPDYYDQHQINCYSHGAVRINVPGVHFNNQNWPHILRGLRFWTAATMVTIPLVSLLLHWIPMPEWTRQWMPGLVLGIYLTWMFCTIYRNGKKYDRA